MAGLGGRDAMLESILYERDEYQRGNLRRAVGTDVETCFNGDIGRESDAHQRDVVLYEIHFLAQSHEILLIVVKDMAQQAAQFLYGRLSLIRIKGDERVDIVQRIEQEMRVELIAQILQFRFRTAFLGFTAGGFHLYPTSAKTDGRTQSYGKYHGKEIAHDEYPLRRAHVPSALVFHFGIGVECVLLPEVHAGGNANYQQHIQQQILPDASLEQIAGDEEAVIAIEHDKKRQRNNTAMTQVFHPRNGESAACHHHKRKGKYYSPADDMNQGFDDARP